eukprot:UN10498
MLKTTWSQTCINLATQLQCIDIIEMIFDMLNITELDLSDAAKTISNGNSNNNNNKSKIQTKIKITSLLSHIQMNININMNINNSTIQQQQYQYQDI